MEFKQLEAFVAVVDYNSFTEAARRLFLTQPTVSAHVKALDVYKRQVSARRTRSVSSCGQKYRSRTAPALWPPR